MAIFFHCKDCGTKLTKATLGAFGDNKTGRGYGRCEPCGKRYREKHHNVVGGDTTARFVWHGALSRQARFLYAAAPLCDCCRHKRPPTAAQIEREYAARRAAEALQCAAV